MSEKRTLVISAFPGCGKTYIAENCKNMIGTLLDVENPIILDADESAFSWIIERGINGKRMRNPNFPQNYIQHIESNMGIADLIFVSSHKEVRDALTTANIEYWLVYPELSAKDSWIGRIFNRKPESESNINICKDLSLNWEKLITDCYTDKNENQYTLEGDVYLSDVMDVYLCILGTLN